MIYSAYKITSDLKVGENGGAKIVNMPAEMLRNETNDRMFMAPYIIANTAILDDRLIRYFNFAPPFSPTLRSDVILYAE